jgi:hypothetical protein
VARYAWLLLSLALLIGCESRPAKPVSPDKTPDKAPDKPAPKDQPKGPPFS